MNKVIKASCNSVEGYWPGLFAKAMKGKNVDDLLANAGNSSAAAGPVAAAAGGAVEEKKEEKSKYPGRVSAQSFLRSYATPFLGLILSCRGRRARGGCRHGRSFRWRLLSARPILVNHHQKTEHKKQPEVPMQAGILSAASVMQPRISVSTRVLLL